MVRLSDDSRDLLTYRPTIDFIEPDLDTTPDIRPLVEKEQPQLKQVELTKQQLRNLAAAVTVLVDAVQARADQRAENFTADLDTKVDAATIAAMKRRFPGEDPNKITYEQYKKAKQDIYDQGRKVGDRMLVSQSDIDNANPEHIGGFGTTKAENDRLELDRELAKSGEDPFDTLPSYTDQDDGTEGDSVTNPSSSDMIDTDRSRRLSSSIASAKSGGLRPELDQRNEIIEPLDVNEFQNILIIILVNYIWGIFRGAFPGFVKKRLRKNLLSYPAGFNFDELLSLPGVLVLGQDSEKQSIPSIPKDLEGIV